MKKLSVFIVRESSGLNSISESDGILFKQQPLFDHLVSVIVPLYNEVTVVTINKSVGSRKKTSVALVENYSGYLGAVYQALSQAKTKFSLLILCQNPMPSVASVHDFLKKHSKQADMSVLHSEANVLPEMAIYSKKMLYKVKEALLSQTVTFRDFLLSTEHQDISSLSNDPDEYTYLPDDPQPSVY